MLFEVKAFNISKMADFLIDTGTTYSAITEKEATIMGIDCSLLPYYKYPAVGFGGLFKIRMINRQAILTFKSGVNEHKIVRSSFRVISIPPTIVGEERERMIRYTPNVLGMDILRIFKTCVEKNKVELIVK